jgi:signal transduction histidine kinase
MAHKSSASFWMPVLGILLSLGLLGGALAYTQRLQRRELEAQLARREGELLAGMLNRQLAGALTNAGPDELLLALLDTTLSPDLPGLASIQVYRLDGEFWMALPGPNNGPRLPEADLDAARAGETRAEFIPAREGAIPELRVTSLLRPDVDRPASAIVELRIEATALSAEFEVLERSLRAQTWRTFLLAGLATTAVLAFAFWRLARTNRLLRERSQHLELANRELVLTAKTSAVGAVASHLVHGLKNPLAALQEFVNTATMDDAPEAMATARRMRSMIDDVVRVLRDENGLGQFELPADEVLRVLERRLGPGARERGAKVTVNSAAALPELPNRTANLVLLILENLCQNALQCGPATGSVRVSAQKSDRGVVEFLVEDDGPGLPESVRKHLFSPVTSTKPGGTGLGLALSHQLARHLGATLDLVRTDSTGTTFRLKLPVLAGAPSGQTYVLS